MVYAVVSDREGALPQRSCPQPHVELAIGLDTGTASTDYIQLWHGDANLLRESLEAVQQTAIVILGAIAPKPEIAQESDPSHSESDSVQCNPRRSIESAAKTVPQELMQNL